jgi:hypothetical protein
LRDPGLIQNDIQAALVQTEGSKLAGFGYTQTVQALGKKLKKGKKKGGKVDKKCLNKKKRVCKKKNKGNKKGLKDCYREAQSQCSEQTPPAKEEEPVTTPADAYCAEIFQQAIMGPYQTFFDRYKKMCDDTPGCYFQAGLNKCDHKPVPDCFELSSFKAICKESSHCQWHEDTNTCDEEIDCSEYDGEGHEKCESKNGCLYDVGAETCAGSHECSEHDGEPAECAYHKKCKYHLATATCGVKERIDCAAVFQSLTGNIAQRYKKYKGACEKTDGCFWQKDVGVCDDRPHPECASMTSRRGQAFWTPTKKNWCERTPGCLWHDASGQCHDEGDCSVHDGLPDACSDEDGCYYHCDTQVCNEEPLPECSKFTDEGFSPGGSNEAAAQQCEDTSGCIWDPSSGTCHVKHCGHIKYEEEVVPKPSLHKKWVKVCKDNGFVYPPPDCKSEEGQDCSTECINLESEGTWKEAKLCGNVECEDERVENYAKMQEWMMHDCKYDQDIFVGSSANGTKEIEIGMESDPHTYIVCGKCDAKLVQFPRTEYCAIESSCVRFADEGYESYEACLEHPLNRKCTQFTDEELLEVYWDKRSCYGINLAEEGNEANIFAYNSRLPDPDSGVKGRRRSSGYQDYGVKRVFRDGKELLEVTKLRGKGSGWEVGPIFKCDLFRGSSCPALEGWSKTGFGAGLGEEDYAGAPGFDVTANPDTAYR